MTRGEWSPIRRSGNVLCLNMNGIWGRSIRIATTLKRYPEFAPHLSMVDNINEVSRRITEKEPAQAPGFCDGAVNYLCAGGAHGP